MNHSPEPWSVVTESKNKVFVADANGQCVLELDWKPSDLELADWNRIVACVNACQGIPTTMLNRLPLCALYSLLLAQPDLPDEDRKLIQAAYDSQPVNQKVTP